LLYQRLGKNDLARKDFEKVIEIGDDDSMRQDAENLLKMLSP